MAKISKKAMKTIAKELSVCKGKANAVAEKELQEYFNGKVYSIIDTVGMVLGLTWSEAYVMMQDEIEKLKRN